VVVVVDRFHAVNTRRAAELFVFRFLLFLSVKKNNFWTTI